MFTKCFCPLVWYYSKLTVLFKPGNRRLCNNYKGISIRGRLAKLNDVNILNRLKLRYDIDKCQERQIMLRADHNLEIAV